MVAPQVPRQIHEGNSILLVSLYCILLVYSKDIILYIISMIILCNILISAGFWSLLLNTGRLFSPKSTGANYQPAGEIAVFHLGRVRRFWMVSLMNQITWYCETGNEKRDKLQAYFGLLLLSKVFWDLFACMCQVCKAVMEYLSAMSNVAKCGKHVR